MSQLSLFSADLTPPRLADLGGLLAAHGQVARRATGARLSILLTERWRAKSLTREFRVRDVETEYLTAAEALSDGLITESDADPWPDGPQPMPAAVRPPVGVLRTAWSRDLGELADSWTRGAVKDVPDGLVAAAGLLRCWTLAAGRQYESGFLLGLDRHAPETFGPLASACASAGLAGAFVGIRAGRPALRIVGRRRLARLVELLGTPPPEAPPSAFPRPEH